MMRSFIRQNALGVLFLGMSVPFLPAQAQAQSEVEANLEGQAYLEKGIDANTPLKDVMEFLKDRYDISIVIDTQAFKAKGIEDVEGSAIHLPKLIRVNLGTILQVTLKQI